MAELEDKVKDLKVEDGPPPKPHPEPESVYGSFVPDLKEYHESVDGRVKLIHEFFIQIAMQNGQSPPSPPDMAYLLEITDEQRSSAGDQGPIVTVDQFVGAFKKMIIEGETKEKFEEKIVKPLKAATGRMKHAKKIMPEVSAILTKFHEKVEGDAEKLFAWFKEMVPGDAKDKIPKEYFMGAVMRVAPDSEKVPLANFLFGVEANLDENDSAAAFQAACDKF